MPQAFKLPHKMRRFERIGRTSLIGEYICSIPLTLLADLAGVSCAYIVWVS